MNILLVGALSWNPERMRSLCERGHKLWGLWSRTMAWEQGPYPSLDGAVTPVRLEDAPRIIREHAIDCVYSLFQAYHPRVWAPPAPGIEHGVWSLLRTLLLERARGAFDAPIVRHWGFDVYNLDPFVARALDGHIFCNREKLAYWSSPVEEGGAGLDVFDDPERITFLDGDRPKLEYMNDRFSERLSDRTGELHTVCVGRPFGIDYLAAARHKIHIHVYGNTFNEVYRSIARDLPLRATTEALLRRYVHVHPSLQRVGASWPEVQQTKSRWVSEFSRYDAGWSYLGTPFPWAPLDDRAAIPSRISTYLLAGLPVITDRRPGYYRYEELQRLGVNIDLVDHDYAAVRDAIAAEASTRRHADRARQARADYSFDATIDALVAALEDARARYFAGPPAERTRFSASDGRIVYFKLRHYKRSAPRSLAGRLTRDRKAAPWFVGQLDNVATTLRERTVLSLKARSIKRTIRQR